MLQTLATWQKGRYRSISESPVPQNGRGSGFSQTIRLRSAEELIQDGDLRVALVVAGIAEHDQGGPPVDEIEMAGFEIEEGAAVVGRPKADPLHDGGRGLVERTAAEEVTHLFEVAREGERPEVGQHFP